MNLERAAGAYLAALPVHGSPAETINVAYVRLGQNPDLPALVFETSKDSLVNHDGAAGLAETELRMTVLSRNLSEAVDIAEELRKAIAGFHGYWSDVHIQCHACTRRPVLIEPTPTGGHPALYQVPLVARMFVSEAT